MAIGAGVGSGKEAPFSALGQRRGTPGAVVIFEPILDGGGHILFTLTVTCCGLRELGVACDPPPPFHPSPLCVYGRCVWVQEAAAHGHRPG